MASFTHYWTGTTCDLHLGAEGEELDHTAGNLFRQRGVAHGDKIYVVNVLRGTLYLIARMRVDKIVSQSEAERILKNKNLWKASDHVIVIPGSGTAMRFERSVPLEIAKQLMFESDDGYGSLKFVSDGVLDRQTLRGVRRLSDSSAILLERILEST